VDKSEDDTKTIAKEFVEKAVRRGHRPPAIHRISATDSCTQIRAGNQAITLVAFRPLTVASGAPIRSDLQKWLGPDETGQREPGSTRPYTNAYVSRCCSRMPSMLIASSHQPFKALLVGTAKLSKSKPHSWSLHGLPALSTG
jgi:hypothetical protein